VKGPKVQLGSQKERTSEKGGSRTWGVQGERATSSGRGRGERGRGGTSITFNISVQGLRTNRVQRLEKEKIRRNISRGTGVRREGLVVPSALAAHLFREGEKKRIRTLRKGKKGLNTDGFGRRALGRG